MAAKFSTRTKHLRRFQERRRVLLGYPITPHAFTEDDVKTYFSGDKIICLLCGRAFRRLGNHLPMIHEVTEDQYREMYGLPWRRGLTSLAAHQAYSIAALASPDAEEKTSRLALARAKMRDSPPKHRPQRPYCVARLKSQAYGPRDAERILSELRRLRTLPEILRDPNGPKSTWFRRYRREHPDFSKAVADAIDAQPFSVQARGESLGQRFDAALRECFDAGMSDHQAAAVLGVTAMSCNKRTKKWRKLRPAS